MTTASTLYAFSVAVSGDQILVAAPGTPGGIATHGRIYAYDYRGSQWSEYQQVEPDPSLVNDEFGYALDMQPGRVLVGGRDKAQAWVFDLEGGSWMQGALFTGPPWFGNSVSLDGDHALIGSRLASPPSEAGAAHLYRFDGSAWSQVLSLDAFDEAAGDEFGSGVALGGGRMLVGSHLDDDGGNNTGSVYAYDFFEEVLIAFSDSISLSAGGVQHLRLRAGEADAGALYLLATTASGTCPGFFLGEVFVPSNIDVFTTSSIAHANTPPFVKTFGTLNAAGQAAPAIHLPAGTNPALAGVHLDHACVVIDPVTLGVRSASNAAGLDLTP